MEMGQGILCLAGVCAFILLVAGWQKRAAVLKNFVLRSVTGIVVIFIMNVILEKTGVQVAVGVNPVSLLAAGILGLPGVAVLYGIAGCSLL